MTTHAALSRAPSPLRVAVAALVVAVVAVTVPIAARVEGNSLFTPSGLRHLLAGGGGAAIAVLSGLRRRDEDGRFTLAVAAVAGGLVPSALVGVATPWTFAGVLWAMLVALPALPVLRGAVRAERTRTLDDGDRALARAGIFVAAVGAPSLLFDWQHGRLPFVGAPLLAIGLAIFGLATRRRVERGAVVRAVLEGRHPELAVETGGELDPATEVLVGGAGDLLVIAEESRETGDYRAAPRPRQRAAIPSFPIVPGWLDDTKVLLFSAACSGAITFGLLGFYEVRRSL